MATREICPQTSQERASGSHHQLRHRPTEAIAKDKGNLAYIAVEGDDKCLLFFEIPPTCKFHLRKKGSLKPNRSYTANVHIKANLWVGMQTSTAILEDSLVVSYQTKHTFVI